MAQPLLAEIPILSSGHGGNGEPWIPLPGIFPPRC